MAIWLIGVAGVVVAGTLACLSLAENRARSDYYRASNKLSKAIEQTHTEMAKFSHDLQLQRDYRKGIELHHASIQNSREIHAQYEHLKKFVRMLATKRNEIGLRIMQLKNQRDNAKVANKLQPKEELQRQREFWAQINNELQILKKEKEALYEKREMCNQQTRKLKFHIRDNCGKQGRDWYERNFGCPSTANIGGLCRTFWLTYL